MLIDMFCAPDISQIVLNRSQAIVQLVNANTTYCLWPRAGGKTSGGIGPRIVRLSEIMPRSQCLLVADTFERINRVLWPSIESFLNDKLGLIENIDYVVHKRPPAHWTTPIFKPVKYDHVISFSSGFCLCEISMEVSGSANGYNAQAAIIDEAKFINEKKFKAEVRPAIRGANKEFGHLPEFQSLWFFTDKLPEKNSDISWLINKKDEVDHAKIEIVYTYQLHVLELQRQLEKATSDSSRYRMQKKIERFEERLRILRKDLVFYSDAEAFENIDNLGEKYYRDMKRDLTDYEFRVAIKNEDPTTEKPYYPTWSSWNLIENDGYDPSKPLIIASDYQFAIAPICAAQKGVLPGEMYRTLNFVQSVHTLDPEGLADAVRLFCRTFDRHHTHHVAYVYDHTALGRNPFKTNFKDFVIQVLNECNWSVDPIYIGHAPEHDIKHEQIKEILARRGDGAVKVVRKKNQFLTKSIEKAPAKLVKGKTQKDKTSERPNSNVPPEEATHYSDVFDQIITADAMGLLDIDNANGLPFGIGG